MNLNHFQRWSLKTRVTLFTLVIFLISIWSLAFYVSRMLREDMQQVLGDQQFSAVSVIASDINRELDDMMRSLEIVAASISPAMLGNPAVLQAYLEEHQIFQRLFNGGSFVTRADGTAIVDVPISAGRLGVNYMDRDHFVVALRQGRLTISKPITGRKMRTPVFAMVAPIRDSQGQVIGALAGVTDLSKPSFLDKITENTYGKTGGYLLIAPQYRLIVTATDKRRIMETLPAVGINPMIDHFVQGNEGSAVFINDHGEEILASVKSVPVAGWDMTAVLPTAEAFAPILAMQQRVLLATIILTLVAGAVTWWMLRRQLAPLLTAVENLATLSNPDRSLGLLPITSQDEIGELTGGFNHLLETLAQREAALKDALNRLQMIASQVPGIVYQFRLRADGSSCVPYANEFLRKIYRVSPEEVRDDASPIISAVHPDDLPEFLDSVSESARNLTPWHHEYRLRFDGEPDIWLLGKGIPQREADGSIIWHGFVTDITERKATEHSINHLAHHDALTGLLNRASLMGRLEQALATVQREHRLLAVMFLDMDRFKTINDTKGHATGDGLLVEVARRLGEIVRNSDIVARIGGDEFVVVLTEVENSPSAARVASKILNSLGEGYIINGHEVRSTPSIGLAFFPTDGDDCETLMRNADTAMYHAKSQGRNNIQFFTPEMNAYAMKRLGLENDIRVGLANRQFELQYQPQMDGGTGHFVGVEALLRWRNPRDGVVLPESFIRVAEETGLILPLGEWVLDEACRQLRDWRDQGLAHVTMAVNLSALQLRSPTLLAFVEQTLQKHGLTGADLELEITESAVMDDPKACIRKLKALRNMGIRLSIDDFGTGYSSLSYLKLMPIHTLKVDQSFVGDIETNANDVAICIATIALAHSLSLSVVAEGVETALQRDFMIGHHCDFLQGFLFSKPVGAEAALAFFNGRIH